MGRTRKKKPDMGVGKTLGVVFAEMFRAVKPLMVGGVLAGCVLLTGCVPNHSGEQEQHKPALVRVPEASAETDDGSSVKGGEDVLMFSGVDVPLSYDEHGMVEAVATDDPKIAAAVAAATLFSVDPTTISAERFLQTAVERITHPDRSYVGPNGEITTGYAFMFGEEPKTWRDDPSVPLTVSFQHCRQKESSSGCSWAELFNKGRFEQLQAARMTVRPTVVGMMSEEQMGRFSPESVPQVGHLPGLDLRPKREGASLSAWWVLLKQSYRFADVEQVSYKRAFWYVWCDRKDEGGLCAVATTLLQPPFPHIFPLEEESGEAGREEGPMV